MCVCVFWGGGLLSTNGSHHTITLGPLSQIVALMMSVLRSYSHRKSDSRVRRSDRHHFLIVLDPTNHQISRRHSGWPMTNPDSTDDDPKIQYQISDFADLSSKSPPPHGAPPKVREHSDPRRFSTCQYGSFTLQCGTNLHTEKRHERHVTPRRDADHVAVCLIN